MRKSCKNNLGSSYAHKIPALVPTYDPVKEVEDAVHAGNHEMGEDFAEEEDEGVNDDNAVLFDLHQDPTEAIWGDGVEDARTVQGWDWDEVEKHEAEINIEEFREDEFEYFAASTVKQAGEMTDQKTQ